MPNNPDQKTQGGDVSGTTFTDVVMGKPIEVASASFEPGYHHNELDATLKQGYISAADLKQGFCSYGEATGDKPNSRDS